MKHIHTAREREGAAFLGSNFDGYLLIEGEILSNFKIAQNYFFQTRAWVFSQKVYFCCSSFGDRDNAWRVSAIHENIDEIGNFNLFILFF